MVSSTASRETLWTPSIGAWLHGGEATFRVWAPKARQVTLVVDNQDVSMAATGDGYFAATLPGARAGQRYRYRVDGQGPFPDPASRFQPDGVHGASALVDRGAFAWSDAGWQGVSASRLTIYELHVGAFTPEGTFRALIDKLPYLKELGITAIELMPVADFPGRWNWGYDGVCLFAPARCYGTPDDLRALVNEAHRQGLAILVDVVYNHLGPDGNYTGAFSPYYFTNRHRSPWGAGVNLDGDYSAEVRRFFIENALHWLHEYHVDGLRLDATHAMVDDSPKPFIAELAEQVRKAGMPWPTHLIAEDHRNLAVMLKPLDKGGWGLDGVWADDFHHEVRRHVAGDHESYYQDFAGTTANIAKTLEQGWLFTGQHSTNLNEDRGTPADGLPYDRFVICTQNHDQVGNRATGDRLHHKISSDAYRATSALMLFAPETPMLFMGQEWAATTPFAFFTDHAPELGKKITEGRRREFKKFSAFQDPAVQKSIPDPQAEGTFAASRLRWEEIDQAAHRGILAWHRRLLSLRQSEEAWHDTRRDAFRVTALDDGALALYRAGATPWILMVRLSGEGTLAWPAAWADLRAARRWELALSSDDASFMPGGRGHVVSSDLSVAFTQPGAVFLKGRPNE